MNTQEKLAQLERLSLRAKAREQERLASYTALEYDNYPINEGYYTCLVCDEYDWDVPELTFNGFVMECGPNVCRRCGNEEQALIFA